MNKRGRGKTDGKKSSKKKGGTPTEQKLHAWVEARNRHHLTHGQVQMARALEQAERAEQAERGDGGKPWR